MPKLRTMPGGGAFRGEDLLHEEFRSVASHFDVKSIEVWRSGLDWLRSHRSYFGVLSWEPFFIGLLREEEAFAGRSISVLLNRDRLIERLGKVHYDGEDNTFNFDSLRDEISEFPEEYASSTDFWTRVLVEAQARKLDLSPEDTLRRIVESVEATPREDWLQEGRDYLEHPGALGEHGLLQDAVIGEIVGSDLAFAELIKSLLNQYQAEISVAIAWRGGRLVVLPHSKLESFAVGRMARGVLSAVEAQFVNQVRLVEETALEEFEDLINSRSLSEGDIHRFLEQHPAFLCLDSHVSVKSHPVLMFEEDRRRVPDFFLGRIDGGLADILELKLPSTRVAVGTQGRRILSAAVARGVAQLREYSKYFDDEDRKREFERQTGLRIYRPNLMLVIGRDRDFHSVEEKRTLAAGLAHDVNVLTYDDVLMHAQGRRLYIDRRLARRVPRSCLKTESP